MALDTQPPPDPSSLFSDSLPPKPAIAQTATVFTKPAETGGMKTRIPRVGYVYDTRMMQHTEVRDPNDYDEEDDDSESHHPEQPRRIECIDKKLDEAGCLELMTKLAIRHLRKDEALLVHSEDHWQKVAAIASMDVEAILNSRIYYDHLSLYVHPKTPEAALLSGGGVIEACLAVARGLVKTSFANVRPPGHHAEPEEHMGFCFFNNVAIATRVVQLETDVKKILILDWDVHHGNGTQRAFYDDPSVLYISIHRYDGGAFYPSGPFGSMESCGEGDGLGASVNIPWPTKGMGDADYLYAFMRIVMPIAYEFAPELVIISAGFDAADGDTLGECHVSPTGYAHMTHMLSSLANGKVVVALEGGYNLNSISSSALAVAEVLLGNPPPMISELTASEIATETIWQVSRVQSHYWSSIDPKQCEPKDTFEEDAIGIPDLFKAHRLDLMAKYGAYAVPFADDELMDAFKNQVLCSQNFYSQPRLVVFIHDYGSLRAELDGVTHVDLDLERSYMVRVQLVLQSLGLQLKASLKLDATRKLVEWVTNQEFALIDVNIFPHKLNQGTAETELLKRLIIYLWDNYIEYAILCKLYLYWEHLLTVVVMTLQDIRSIGHCVPGQREFLSAALPTADYKACRSLVIVPETHPTRFTGKWTKSCGLVETTVSEKPTKALAEAIPTIERFLQTKIELPHPQPIAPSADPDPLQDGEPNDIDMES
ncbi:Histone deacetylase hda1 [Tulasnella sp. 425]|nr:Histone deacetylase hda1 [Tulasnella sp. 425]